MDTSYYYTTKYKPCQEIIPPLAHILFPLYSSANGNILAITSATAFAISGLLAGIAAIFIIARRGAVDPTLGFNPVLKAFVACVVGGFGSLTGAVLGGFLLGALEVGMLVILPQSYGGMKDAFVFAIIAIILVWRPEGILSPQKEKGDKI